MTQRTQSLLILVATWLQALVALVAATLMGPVTAFAEGVSPGGAAQDNNTPVYPTVASSLVYAGQAPATIGEIYWLDNDRALLEGRAIEHQKMPDGRDQPSVTPPGIFILNTKKNIYEHYADLIPSNFWFFCFNRGFISYSVSGSTLERSTIVVKAGQMGHEVPISNDYIKANSGVPGCRGWPRDDRQPEANIRRYALAPEDGYIIVGIATQDNASEVDGAYLKDPVRLQRPGGAKPIPLPITAYEMGWHARLSYSDYAHKYLLIPHREPVGYPPKTPLPIYVIAPDGKVDRYEIPHGWELGVQAVYLTKRGLFWVTNTTQHDQSKTAGGWLTRDDQSVKLFDEQLAAAEVSPDGCRILYQVIARHRGDPIGLQVMDLCAAAAKG